MACLLHDWADRNQWGKYCPISIDLKPAGVLDQEIYGLPPLAHHQRPAAKMGKSQGGGNLAER